MKRKFLWSAFALYAVYMLWLLFIRYRSVTVTDYWVQFWGRLQLIPFGSTGSMLWTLYLHPTFPVLWEVVYNIGGNIVMFVPLGFFLRLLVPRCRGLLHCLGTVAVIMTCVELLQLFTLRGFCDIDDLVLNLCGATIGWHLAKKKETVRK